MDRLDPDKQRKLDEFNNMFDNTMLQMIDESEQVLMDNQVFFKISNDPKNRALQYQQWSILSPPAVEHRFLFMPLHTINKLKKGFVSVTPGAELSNYSTIMDLAYASRGNSKTIRIPALYRHLAVNFAKMVKVCLRLQREGELTQEMLDTLIDTVEVMSPLERLIVTISDLETYRNM
mmetsp:Transcript_45639/g.60503  ORF Transcript_45639/g.60503 Transcript_45639/m.60503 type:complete len:177 (+) Transcript_45639:321-851(+)|eukprot:CAMPEP_0185587396 /NCGR_PEP_ID=MMETSP0434-20130131/48913_1 /TAXON_ID=626734 ORGANISM="Favella taraikaensis, Strain Fe Narragansett Bay" /NCGR_SAMPLE_ID=MMETSP0434 /ASSEMBLY_ACC=CAM_ASM_000379 /LENGTH=176 /DNA_ID=CAMNT_0028209231 /DNA_START=321 /DNA_END=851 /DNA_ORIENTATION=-